ncbi:RNA polymerase sigma factor [Cytobacillus gottheilii]|uniref:RNA polymerase sigma factor n=1 Tax=Cytobacillus gottheilii TaxID=859144 RepID=UPI0009B94DA1|nr:sigma-70 family RNA polymerase sigma factor [Cytobacillus gottheilii]
MCVASSIKVEADRRGEREISDQVLIQKVKSGNDHAFRLLVEKYRQDVFRTIYAVLRDEKEAEDAAQEVFMKIYTSLSQYEDQGFKTWMKRIAVNHAIDVKRKKDKRQEDSIESAGYDLYGGQREQVETEVMNRARRKLVIQRLDELPDNYRHVIYDFYIREKTYQQMAKEQNVQVKTIETKLYRARIWMKKHWKEDDFS